VTNAVPGHPKIYHILHIDRLPNIIACKALYSDSIIAQKDPVGTNIGMGKIKARRLELPLASHPGLYVGDCVPFYFCPRSVMLYMFYMNNHHEIEYRGGQGPIIHPEADLYRVIDWAEVYHLRWAFTLSNAGARYFEDRVKKIQLNELN
jgi:hypothetical protein